MPLQRLSTLRATPHVMQAPQTEAVRSHVNSRRLLTTTVFSPGGLGPGEGLGLLDTLWEYATPESLCRCSSIISALCLTYVPGSVIASLHQQLGAEGIIRGAVAHACNMTNHAPIWQARGLTAPLANLWVSPEVRTAAGECIYASPRPPQEAFQLAPAAQGPQQVAPQALCARVTAELHPDVGILWGLQPPVVYVQRPPLVIPLWQPWLVVPAHHMGQAEGLPSGLASHMGVDCLRSSGSLLYAQVHMSSGQCKKTYLLPALGSQELHVSGHRSTGSCTG